ncbi:response regulator [Methyloglobulus sp.]|uniref:response regulator n=1 Tax=Methyloglobulus sp. TaxID=2518622 RepID=UPI0032B7806D
MEQNNIQPERKYAEDLRPLRVALLGFEAVDEACFIRFFQVERSHQRKYIAAKSSEKASSDILLVNYDNPAALGERDVLADAQPHAQVVAASRGPLIEPPTYHIRGMLFAARVLTTLDKVPVATCTELAVVEPKLQQAAHPEQQLVGVSRPQVAETRLPQVNTIVADADKPIPVVTIPTVATHDKAGYRALVVDDSVAIQKSLELNLVTLPQMGVIDFADSGESALEKADAVQYDLIFLDVMMPGIDGYETCIRLRKKPEYKKTPIIMVSGKTSPLDEVKGVMAGCTTYLTKPVQQEAFQKLSIRVLSWLEKKKTA